MYAYRLLSRDVIDHPVHGPSTVLSAITHDTEGYVAVRVRDRNSVEHDLRITLGSDVPLTTEE